MGFVRPCRTVFILTNQLHAYYHCCKHHSLDSSATTTDHIYYYCAVSVSTTLVVQLQACLQHIGQQATLSPLKHHYPEYWISWFGSQSWPLWSHLTRLDCFWRAQHMKNMTCQKEWQAINFLQRIKESPDRIKGNNEVVGKVFWTDTYFLWYYLILSFLLILYNMLKRFGKEKISFIKTNIHLYTV